MDKGRLCGIASMDLSKAFDSVSHGLLLKKLSNLGFAKHSLEWIKSYLTGRTQQVKFHQGLSDITAVESGVPQGSVLWPILFIAFTSDLASHLEGYTIKAYADDTQILVSGSNTQEVKLKLEHAINIAQDWFKNNSLQINPSKTEILLVRNSIRSRTDEVKINLQDNGHTIQVRQAHKIKILGVILDETLSWKDQVKQVKGRAANVIRHLARSAKVLPQTSRRLLYDALVCPHLSYADVVWDGCLKRQETELQRIHNFAARVISGSDRHTPVAFRWNTTVSV